MFTSLHCTALHCTALQRPILPYFTTMHFKCHHKTPTLNEYRTLLFGRPTALHCTALHFTSLHFTSLHFTALHTALHCTALHSTALHCTALHSTLFVVPLHFVLSYCDISSVHRPLLYIWGLLRTAPLPLLSLSMTTSPTATLLASKHELHPKARWSEEWRGVRCPAIASP